MSMGGYTFRAFNNRNYTLFFMGQSVSRIGTWMQRTGVNWVVYTMTHSALMLGVAVFAEQFPSFLFSLWGGITADRYNRYHILMITQIVSMLQAVLLAVLVLTGHFTVWPILVLSVVLGITNAFDVPARQPMVHEMINDKADLPNALAFSSAMNNLAMLLGPALAGIVLQKFGACICFMLNAISFVAVMVSLYLMKMPPYSPPTVKKKAMSDMLEGFNYIRNTPALASIVLLLTLMSLLVIPYNTLLPVFAKVVYNGDAATFGYINSFIGLGAIVGTFFLASLKSGANLKKLLVIDMVALGVCLMLFAKVTYFPLAMLFAAVCGFGIMSQNTICNITLQGESDSRMRGRVISYFAMSIFGMVPLGSLLTGAVSHYIGAQNTVLCQGFIALVIAALFYRYLRTEQLKQKKIKQLSEAEEMAAQN